MDETEGMEALKAAYAEVILNTMKEAATRVMESEQKALRIEQDLQSTKDEALRLLLRLKHMIDAKATEAEISSINQQRRIDELEAQLNEAEGLVVDLRAELNLVREELDEAKKKKSVEDDPVLSSMIMKNKEAEMYRNGLMQGIHAAGDKLHPGDDPCFAAHSKPTREFTETKAGMHVEASLKMIKKMENHIHQRGLLKGNVKRDRPTRLHGKIKRRKGWHGKAKTNLHRCLRNERLKSKQPLPALPHCRNHSSTGNNIDSCGVTTTNVERINTLDNSSVLGEKVQQSNAQSVLVRRSERKRKIKYWDDAASMWRSHDYHSNQCRKVSQPCHRAKPVKCNVKFTEEQLESQSIVQIKDHADCIASQHAPRELRESECTHNIIGDITELDRLIDVPMTLKQDSRATQLELESRLVISDREDAKTSQRSHMTLDQADIEGRLMYTFSRKRKKNSPINPVGRGLGEEAVHRETKYSFETAGY